MAKINIGKFINNLDTEDLTSEKLQGVANNVYAKAISTHKKGQEITDDRLKDQDKETVEFVKDNHDRLANNDEEDEKLNNGITEGKEKKIDLYVNGEYVCSSNKYKRAKDFVDAVRKEGKVTYASVPGNATKEIKDTDKVTAKIVKESFPTDDELMAEIKRGNEEGIKKGSAKEFSDVLFDTIMGNTRYPNINPDLIDDADDNEVNANEHWMTINYGGHKYRINVELIESLKGEKLTEAKSSKKLIVEKNGYKKQDVSIKEAAYSYTNSNDDNELVKAAYEHFVNDLGITPSIDDVLEDIYNNFDQDMFIGMSDPTESAKDRRDVKAILNRLNLEYLDESLEESSSNESKDDKFKVFVEYTDGEVKVFDNISSEDWFNYLQPDLEKDDRVVHYDAEKITDENDFDVDNNSLNEDGGIQKFCIKVSPELVPSAGRNYVTKDALQANNGYIDNLGDITDYKSAKKTLLFDSHDEANEFITQLAESFNCDFNDFKVEQFFNLGGTLLDSLTESVLSELELALKRLGKEKAAALEKYLEEVSPKENFNKYMDAARQLPSTPAGAADYEKLKKEFNVLTLDDVLYNEAEWNKFEDWLEKHSELLEHLDAGENEDIEDLENLDFDEVAKKTEETLEEDFDTKSSEESNMDLKELYEKEKEALLKEEKEPQDEEEAWKTNLREIQEKCIKEYRQFAGLKDGEAITEENINEKELGKVSSRNNYDVEDLRKVLIKGAMR